eukprot:PRCOL_00003591-RA
MESRRTVAVVGAGAAGLAAARELALEGLAPTVFEAGESVGGVWAFTEETDSDAAGADPARKRVHGSMYRNLRTNLPRELMSYAALPFGDAEGGGDTRRFVGHEAVEHYLEAYADRYGLREHVRLGTRVLEATPVDAAADGAPQVRLPAPDWRRPGAAVGLVPDTTAWRVTSSGAAGGDGGSERRVEVFDALCVCNGHYSEPRLPALPGADAFPGELVHSHNYRDTKGYEGKHVVVVGAGASGEDIAREVASVAECVHLSARSWKQLLPGFVPSPDDAPIGAHKNVYRRGDVVALHADGSVDFECGARAPRADIVLMCTGYTYAFPFLEGANAVAVEDNRVGPLYEHMFTPALGASLSFIGLPWRVVPFPQFELQAKRIAAALSGRAPLPAGSEMAAHAAAEYARLDDAGVPQRHTHMLGAAQFEYNDRLADACAAPRLPQWLTGQSKRAQPELYRDEHMDEHLLPLVAQEVAQMQRVQAQA